jgi:predicted MFS family arabinose efflux permease
VKTQGGTIPPPRGRAHDLSMDRAEVLPAWGRIQVAVAVTLFLCLFAAQAGLIVLTPVLSEVADDLDVSTAAAGQLRTVSGLAAGLAAILLGTVGRDTSLRRVLVGGAAGLAIASIVSSAAPNFAVLALAQALLGMSVAALLVGGTVAAAEWVPKEHRTRVLAWALVGPPTAWIVGMPLAGAIGGIDWRWTWLAVPLVAALAAGAAVAIRPESPRAATSESMTTALRNPPTARWVLGELLGSSAWVGTLVFSGALFTESYGATSTVTGFVLAGAAAAYVAGNVYFRRIVECRAHILLVRMSLVLAVGVALFGIVRTSLPVSAALFAATGFIAGGRTLIGSAVGLDATPEQRLAVMGARAAAAQLGYFLGSAFAGGALSAAGYSGFGLASGLLFVASAVPFMVDARKRAGTFQAALMGPACAREA